MNPHVLHRQIFVFPFNFHVEAISTLFLSCIVWFSFSIFQMNVITIFIWGFYFNIYLLMSIQKKNLPISCINEMNNYNIRVACGTKLIKFVVVLQDRIGLFSPMRYWMVVSVSPTVAASRHFYNLNSSTRQMVMSYIS